MSNKEEIARRDKSILEVLKNGFEVNYAKEDRFKEVQEHRRLIVNDVEFPPKK